MRRGPRPIDDTVPSPCVGTCRVDKDSRQCTGCLRTLDEIRDWRTLSAHDKRAVLEAIAERRATST
jgi:predicted Fe-S protein YdhL (DUF1289 family)